MVDPKTIDPNLIPKTFCDGGFSYVYKEVFQFFLTHGNRIEGFACIPTQMKALAKMFNEQIRVYEEKFGEIKLEEKDNESIIISPFKVL